MVLTIILSMAIGGLLIYGWVKLINLIFYLLIKKSEKKHSDTVENPYIKVHLINRKNDMDYAHYLDWLDKTGGGLPIDIVLTREEWEFRKELNL